jgi:hypothetical protein
MIDERDRDLYDPAEPRVHEYGTGPEYRADAPRLRGESTVGLLSGLAHDVTTLVKQEAALVRAELGEKVEQAKAGMAETASGAFVAFAGFLFVLLAGVLALDEVLNRPWLSALVVGGAVLLVGLFLLARGKSNLKATNLVPERAREQLKEDARLVRSEARETARAVDPRPVGRPETTGGAL